MEKESVLKYNIEKGFGETFWITCPCCWSAMKVTHWEFGTAEEDCSVCQRMEREMEKAKLKPSYKSDE
jgi:hypothetical protein